MSLTIEKRSHRKMLKSIGSKIDPCVTPYLIRLNTKNYFFLTRWCLFVK